MAAGQTVLDALLERGHAIPNNCRAGVCQSCLMRALEGEIPAPAQQGLKDTLKAQNYILACRCVPESSLEVALPTPDAVRTTARVVSRELLGDDVLRLRLKTQAAFDYHAGQYVTLWSAPELGRSYSLASVPALDEYLEMHVGRVAGGRMSTRLFETLEPGDQLQLQTAAGNCFYVPGNPTQSLLLAGTGTGLAPLFGIVRDALQQGHHGEIHLIHGAVKAGGLYLHDVLSSMADAHDNFHYHASVLDADGAPEQVSVGSIETVVAEAVPDPAQWKVYLCGNPALVNALRKTVFLAGASMGNIYSDPFLTAADTASAA